MPAFLIGKHELQTTPDIISTRSSSNGLLLSNLLGDTSPSPLPATFVHLDDAAMVHVLALNPAVQGNQDFVANSGGLDGGAVWDDALYIARKHFPEAVAKGILPLGGSTPAQILRVDGSRAEKVFGFKYRDFEAQVVSLVGHYVDVAEKTAAKGVANGTMDGLVNGSSR